MTERNHKHSSDSTQITHTNRPNVYHSFEKKERSATSNETENDCKVIARRNLQMLRIGKGDVDLQLMNTSLLTGLDGGWWLTVTDWGAGNWVWLRARKKRDCKWKSTPCSFLSSSWIHQETRRKRERERERGGKTTFLSHVFERDDFLLPFHCQASESERQKRKQQSSLSYLPP